MLTQEARHKAIKDKREQREKDRKLKELESKKDKLFKATATIATKEIIPPAKIKEMKDSLNKNKDLDGVLLSDRGSTDDHLD